MSPALPKPVEVYEQPPPLCHDELSKMYRCSKIFLKLRQGSRKKKCPPLVVRPKRPRPFLPLELSCNLFLGFFRAPKKVRFPQQSGIYPPTLFVVGQLVEELFFRLPSFNVRSKTFTIFPSPAQRTKNLTFLK